MIGDTHIRYCKMNDIERRLKFDAIDTSKIEPSKQTNSEKKRRRTRREIVLSAEDSHFNFHSRFEGDGGDLLDNFTGRVQIDQTLVNAEFVSVLKNYRRKGG